MRRRRFGQGRRLRVTGGGPRDVPHMDEISRTPQRKPRTRRRHPNQLTPSKMQFSTAAPRAHAARPRAARYALAASRCLSDTITSTGVGSIAAQHGDVERDEVAEQHERQHALDGRVAARLRRRTCPSPARRSARAVSAMRSCTRGCVSLSSRKTAAKRPSAGALLPADDLVVVELGQLVRERRDLRVLVELRLPAVGDRRRQARAGDDRRRCRAARARAPWPRSPRRRRRPTRRRAARGGRRRRRSRTPIRGPAPHSAATSSAATVM